MGDIFVSILSVSAAWFSVPSSGIQYPGKYLLTVKRGFAHEVGIEPFFHKKAP